MVVFEDIVQLNDASHPFGEVFTVELPEPLVEFERRLICGFYRDIDTEARQNYEGARMSFYYDIMKAPWDE